MPLVAGAAVVDSLVPGEVPPAVLESEVPVLSPQARVSDANKNM